MKWDGHSHTQFCYHGSHMDLRDYLRRAVELGFERYSVTEHPPLPDGWIKDEELMRELAMPEWQLPEYMEYVNRCQEEFSPELDVSLGLELDYLPGRESFTLDLVDQCKHNLDEAVVSVHYLPGVAGMRCLDLSPEDFRAGLLAYYGSMDHIVDEYFNHVEAAIEFAGQLPMRTRIGHINLIEKFRLVLPSIDEMQMTRRLKRLLPLLLTAGVGVDVNTAGLRKTTCHKAYVPVWFIEECVDLGISCVYGSDAHHPDDVGAGYDWFAEVMAAVQGD